MDFEEIVRFLGSWYCSYSQYYLLDEFDEYVDAETNVCVPFQHIGGLNVVEKTDKIMRFIEPLIPRVDAIKKQFGFKITRTLMMSISDLIATELKYAWDHEENQISFTLNPSDLLLFNEFENVLMLEIMLQFLNEHGEPLDNLEFSLTLTSPYRVIKDGKEYTFRMNTYLMSAFHHKFDVSQFHETPLYNEWFKSHVGETSISEEEDSLFQVAPEHMLLLSDNTAIFNRFKFNKELHLPSPFCRWTIEFENNDHNESTADDRLYGITAMKEVREIKLGFVVVADPVPGEDLLVKYPNVAWRTGDWVTKKEANDTIKYRDVWCADGETKVVDTYCAHLDERPESLNVTHEVEWMWGDPNRPHTPEEKQIPMVNPNRVKYAPEVYEEILEVVEDDTKIKEKRAKYISAMTLLLIGLAVGFPFLKIWRRFAHGERVYRVEVDTFLEEQKKRRSRNKYL